MAAKITITFELTPEQVGPFMAHFASYLATTKAEDTKKEEIGRGREKRDREEIEERKKEEQEREERETARKKEETARKKEETERKKAKEMNDAINKAREKREKRDREEIEERKKEEQERESFQDAIDEMERQERESFQDAIDEMEKGEKRMERGMDERERKRDERGMEREREKEIAIQKSRNMAKKIDQEKLELDRFVEIVENGCVDDYSFDEYARGSQLPGFSSLSVEHIRKVAEIMGKYFPTTMLPGSRSGRKAYLEHIKIVVAKYQWMKQRWFPSSTLHPPPLESDSDFEDYDTADD